MFLFGVQGFRFSYSLQRSLTYSVEPCFVMLQGVEPHVQEPGVHKMSFNGEYGEDLNLRDTIGIYFIRRLCYTP